MADIGMNFNYFERPKLPANEGSLGGEKYINNRYIRQNSLNISRPKLPAAARSLGGEKYLNNRHIRQNSVNISRPKLPACKGRVRLREISPNWVEFSEISKRPKLPACKGRVRMRDISPNKGRISDFTRPKLPMLGNLGR